jgi:hypothetical protein
MYEPAVADFHRNGIVGCSFWCFYYRALTFDRLTYTIYDEYGNIVFRH